MQPVLGPTSRDLIDTQESLEANRYTLFCSIPTHPSFVSRGVRGRASKIGNWTRLTRVLLSVSSEVDKVFVIKGRWIGWVTRSSLSLAVAP